MGEPTKRGPIDGTGERTSVPCWRDLPWCPASHPLLLCTPRLWHWGCQGSGRVGTSLSSSFPTSLGLDPALKWLGWWHGETSLSSGAHLGHATGPNRIFGFSALCWHQTLSLSPACWELLVAGRAGGCWAGSDGLWHGSPGQKIWVISPWMLLSPWALEGSWCWFLPWQQLLGCRFCFSSGHWVYALMVQRF